MSRPQDKLRLWWVATYHDGETIYESERAGEISSQDVDRANLKRFSLVDQDGVEFFGLDFPEGEDPKLVYRRRSFVGPEQVTGSDLPDWLIYPWTYIVGRHFSDGRLELYSLDPDEESFQLDPDADVQLVPCEEF